MSITLEYKEEIMPSSKRTVRLSVEQIDVLMDVLGPIMEYYSARWDRLPDDERQRADMLADVENILFQAGSTMEDN